MINNSATESKLLSIVITGRDDDYMPDFLYRITTTLNFIALHLHHLGRLEDAEIIIVDWGSGKPMVHTLNLSPQAKQISRFLYIPPELIKEIQNGKDSFHPAMSVNAGIRKSCGSYVMLSAADIIFTRYSLDSLLKLLDGTYQFPIEIQRTYFICPRYNVPWQFLKRQPTLDEWDNFLLTTAGEYREHSVGAINSISSSAGSLLMHRLLWHEMRGLDEKLASWGFNDIDLSLRMSQKYAWIELTCIGVSSFHMSHIPYDQRPVGKQNLNPHRYHKDIQVNDENWGLNNYPLQLIKPDSPDVHSEDVLKLNGRFFSGKTSRELQDEIQSVNVSRELPKNIHIFDYAWNLHVPLNDYVIESLLFISWYCLSYYPRRYVHYGITQNNVANIYAVAQYCPSTEIYALGEWEGLNTEPTPERIALKLKRKTNHSGYVRFLNGDLGTALERLQSSIIGHSSFDLAYVQCNMNNDAALRQILEVLKHISPEGILILNCFTSDRLQYLLNEIRLIHSPTTFIRTRKGNVGVILHAALSDQQPEASDLVIDFSQTINFTYLLKLNSKIYRESLFKVISVMTKPSLYREYFKNLYGRLFS